MLDLILNDKPKKGATAPFTPAAITSIIAWYHVNTLDHLLSATNSVSTWTDFSGNQHSVTQTGASRPTYQVVSGKSVVRFASSGPQWMASTAFANAIGTGDFSVAALIRVATGSSSNGIFSALGDGRASCGVSPDGTNWVGYYYNGANSKFFDVLHANNTWFVVFFVRASGTVSLYVDNVVDTATKPLETVSLSGTRAFVVGDDSVGGSGNPFNGDIRDIAFYTTALTAQNRSDLYDYLNARKP